MGNRFISFVIGLLFIFTGIWVLKTPVISYLTLATLFSITFLINGVFELIYYISNRKKINGYSWGVAGGILDVILGLWLISSPFLSAKILPLFIGFMLLFRSSTIIALALDAQTLKIKFWGWLLAFGILGVLFSFLLLWNPLFAQMTIITWTALSFIAIGISKLVVSLQKRTDR